MLGLRAFNGFYEGTALEHLHFPIGGLGSGMFTLDGTGAFSHFSLRHRPDFFHEPFVFSALAIKGVDGVVSARVLEGPVPAWKLFFPWDRNENSSGMGGWHRSFGLSRFESAQFKASFPFAHISLSDQAVPLKVAVTGWNPFVPGDADASSLPVGCIEYRFKNPTGQPIEGTYSFHAENFMAVGDTGQSVREIGGGFELRQDALPGKPEVAGSFAAWIDEPDAAVDAAWRGFDAPVLLWRDVEAGRVVARPPFTEGKPSRGGSIYFPFRLAPGEEKTINLLLGWHVPHSTLRTEHDSTGKSAPDPLVDCYRPWYAGRFKDIGATVAYWTEHAPALRRATETFTACFYDTTLPPEVTEAVAANLTVLKSTTVLRQSDGRLWAWEGSRDEVGSCPGSCTHVWNYAQALAHLFPDLERGLRETEFNVSQDERGHQNFRTALPIRPDDHVFQAAADGQLGGLLKVYRDWRISGDTAWLRRLWPRVRKSLDYCIETWDPEQRGVLTEPHHNTYDIEFWGPNGMCTSFYLCALGAAAVMGRALGDDVELYATLLRVGKAFLEQELFNGEYFIQKIRWQGLRAADPVAAYAAGSADDMPEIHDVLRAQGPRYQYGDGCLSDGIVGEWLSWAAGLEPVVARDKIESHLLSIHRHNFRPDLSTVANTYRPAYASGHEAGLILCSWPGLQRLSLPFFYWPEVWTGVEYQVASHLISLGHVEEGLEIVRACRRRYDGTVRNPFDELECGHWYARSMSSYALIQALGGARYDAVERTLYLEPQIAGDFRCFLATAGGFGTVGVRMGEPFLEVRSGKIEVARIEYRGQSAVRDGLPNSNV